MHDRPGFPFSFSLFPSSMIGLDQANIIKYHLEQRIVLMLNLFWQICERQQRDISYMQLQLQSSHDMLSKHVTEPE